MHAACHLRDFDEVVSKLKNKYKNTQYKNIFNVLSGLSLPSPKLI